MVGVFALDLFKLLDDFLLCDFIRAGNFKLVIVDVIGEDVGALSFEVLVISRNELRVFGGPSFKGSCIRSEAFNALKVVNNSATDPSSSTRICEKGMASSRARLRISSSVRSRPCFVLWLIL